MIKPQALVTGGNGFIGSHLVRELVTRGYDVRCLVRHTSDLTSLKGLPVRLYIGDVREPGTLDVPMQGAEYVYHLAAEVMVVKADEFEATNTLGTENLLKAAEKNAANTLKRFLLTSSLAAIGPGTDPTPRNEAAEARPISRYGVSKRKAENIANDWASTLPVTIVRPPAVYGEREKVLSRMYPLLASGFRPKLGFKTKHLSMVYVGDLVRGMVKAAESEASRSRTYFLAHPEVLTDLAVTQIAGDAMGKRFGIPLVTPQALLWLFAPVAELAYYFTGNRPPMTRDKMRELSQNYWVADSSKARDDFGWDAKYALSAGMQKTLSYFFAERAKVHALDGQNGLPLWGKYILVSILIGTLIEITSSVGRFYTFDPWWTVFVVTIFAFGMGLGSVAMWLRRRNAVIQFVLGSALAIGVELLAALDWLPYFDWTFTPGWPFGITDDIFRAIVVGLVGGVVVVLNNTIQRALYRRRLRVG